MTKRMKGTTSPMNTGAFKRVFSVLVVLLLAATLMVGAGSADDPATTEVGSLEDLQKALTEGKTSILITNAENKELLVNGDEDKIVSITIPETTTITIDEGMTVTVEEKVRLVINGKIIISPTATLDITNVPYGSKDESTPGLLAGQTGNIEIQGTLKLLKDWNGYSVNALFGNPNTKAVFKGSVGAKVIQTEDSGPITYTYTQYGEDDSATYSWFRAGSKIVVSDVTLKFNGDVDAKNEGYIDLAKAVSEAEADATITLLDNVVLDKLLVINKALTLNGEGHTITLNVKSDENADEIAVAKEAGVTGLSAANDRIAIYATAFLKLNNLNILSGEDATFGEALRLTKGGELTDCSIVITNDAKRTDAEKRCPSIAVMFNAGTNKVTNCLIIAGNSDRSSSQCVVLAGGTVEIKDSYLVTGNANPEYVDVGTVHTSSGSIAVRVSGATATATVTDSHIYSDAYTKADLIAFFGQGFDAARLAGVGDGTYGDQTDRHSAFAIDGSKISASSKVIAKGNTIKLASNPIDHDIGGYGTVVYLNANGVDAGAADVDLQNNKVTGSTFAVYADDATAGFDADKNGEIDPAAGTITLTGNIYNNNFKDIHYGSSQVAGSGFTFTDNAKWNADSITEVTADTSVVEGQKYVAGNYWFWSTEQAGTPTGYAVLTEMESKIGVKDLKPLVKVNTDVAITIEGADGAVAPLSIKKSDTAQTLVAKLATDSDATFTWTATPDVLTLTTSPGASITYAVDGEKFTEDEGIVTLKVAYEKNPDVFEEVTITIYKEATPSGLAVGTVTDTEKTAAGYTATIDSTGIKDADGNPVQVGTSVKEAVIPGNGADITLSFAGDGAEVRSGEIEGTITLMVAEYKPAVVQASQELPAEVTYELGIELDASKALVAGDVTLPTITPTMDPTIGTQIGNDLYVPLAMITAAMSTGTLADFDEKVNKVNLKFVIDTALTGKEFKVIHFGNGEIIDAYATVNGGETIITAESPYGFSSYVLVQDNTPSAPSSSGSPSSGSSVWLQEPVTPTEQPTETPTEQPTTPTDTVPTDIPSTQPTATPSTPGFGVLAVLAGLGAVAVLRRQ